MPTAALKRRKKWMIRVEQLQYERRKLSEEIQTAIDEELNMLDRIQNGDHVPFCVIHRDQKWPPSSNQPDHSLSWNDGAKDGSVRSKGLIIPLKLGSDDLPIHAGIDMSSTWLSNPQRGSHHAQGDPWPRTEKVTAGSLSSCLQQIEGNAESSVQESHTIHGDAANAHEITIRLAEERSCFDLDHHSDAAGNESDAYLLSEPTREEPGGTWPNLSYEEYIRLDSESKRNRICQGIMVQQGQIRSKRTMRSGFDHDQSVVNREEESCGWSTCSI